MKRTATLTVAGVLSAAAVAGTAAVATAGDDDRRSARPSTSEVAALFDTWNRALATGDAEKVARLYTRDATLLPTLTADIKEGRAEIAEYFRTQFLPKKPQGVVTESHVRIIDRDSAYRTGLYDFTLTGADGTTSVAPARFTFVYERVDGRWLIDSQHSSVQPG